MNDYYTSKNIIYQQHTVNNHNSHQARTKRIKSSSYKMSFFIFSKPTTTTTKIPPHEMANTAMSDNMTIGLEQIVVSLTLMIISLCVLSRHKLFHGNDKDDNMMNNQNNKRNIKNTRWGRFYNFFSWKNYHRNTRNNQIMNNTMIGGQKKQNNNYYINKSNRNLLTQRTINRKNNCDRIMKTKNNSQNSDKNVDIDSTCYTYNHRYIHNSPMRKIQSSPMVSTIPESIITTNTTGGIVHPQAITSNYPNGDQSLQSQNNHHQYQQQQQQNNYDEQNINIKNTNNNYNYYTTSSPNTIDNDDYDDELTTLTDHERFVRAYESHLKYSEYRRLILPSDCRLLDAKTTAGMNKTSNEDNNNINNNNNNNTENSNQVYPLISSLSSSYNDQSLFRIISWFIDTTHKIVSFDYIGYMILFNVRIIKALICRYQHIMVAWGYDIKIEDEDDEDDDGTVGSVGSRRSLLSKESNHGITSVGGTVGMGGALSPNKHSALDCKGLASSTADTALISTPTTTVTSNNTNCNNINNTISSTASSDGDKHNLRERFYTGEIFSSAQLKTKSVGREDLLHQSKLESNKSLDDSVISLSGFGESWESGPQTNNYILDPSLLIPPSNVLLEKVEEKNDGLSMDDSSVNNNTDPTILNDLANPPDAELDLLVSPPPSIDNPPTLERIDKKFTTKPPSITPKRLSTTRATSLSRPGSKRKDHLEAWRNPAASMSSHITNNQKSTLNGERESHYLLDNNKDNSMELNYFDTVAKVDTFARETLPDMQGYILGDQLLKDPKKDTPLLIFVNSRSGSQQGLMLKMQLRSLMNPIQVWDLTDGDPEKVLRSFMVFSKLRILVCGGDGTVSWIISTLNKMKVERWPPIAILPLGTGNDLARIHGWGGGYANESLLLILKQVQEAYISLLDRWTVTIESKKKKKKVVKNDGLKKPFTNYMSIGMDALSALQVHNLRENSPDMFFSRAINKLWYGLYGAEDALKASCSDLPQQIILKADGVKVPIPEDCRGLIILNIDSYLGGVPLWSRGVPLYHCEKNSSPSSPPKLGRRYSDGDEIANMVNFQSLKRTNSSDSVADVVVQDDNEKLQKLTACDAPSSCQDGRLDVITIRGNFHLGQIRVGLANAQKLCQCSRLEIELKKSIAMQLDGEPWKQDKSVLTIEREMEPAIMLHRAAEGGGGMEAEVADLLDWAEENDVIKRDAHAILMKEFSRRIESKTRERRDQSEKTVFSAMKKSLRSRQKLPQIT